MSAVPIITVSAIGLLGWKLFGKKRKRTSGPSSSDPTLDCGLYRWKPLEVDRALDEALATGQRDADALALQAAAKVYPTTPEGPSQPWPPHAEDSRAQCVLDRIRSRVDVRLAELGDDDGPGGSDPVGPLPNNPPTGPTPPGPPKPTPGTSQPPVHSDPVPAWPSFPTNPSFPTAPKPPTPTQDPTPVTPVFPPDPIEPDPEWPDYPPPKPVNLTEWTDPGNYPTPDKFHQVGGSNSATTIQAIARKALTTAFYLTFGDLDLAVELAHREENWRAYREAINCVPWNHALYGAANEPGTSGAYDTPHGDTISMYPTHAHVAQALAQGDTPERRVRHDNRKLPAGGRHAFLWLPPLDQDALQDGRVELDQGLWWTGDSRVQPPPEVLTLGVANVPPGVWGCGGYEVEYEEV